MWHVFRSRIWPFNDYRKTTAFAADFYLNDLCLPRFHQQFIYLVNFKVSDVRSNCLILTFRFRAAIVCVFVFFCLKSQVLRVLILERLLRRCSRIAPNWIRIKSRHAFTRHCVWRHISWRKFCSWRHANVSSSTAALLQLASLTRHFLAKLPTVTTLLPLFKTHLRRSLPSGFSFRTSLRVRDVTTESQSLNQSDFYWMFLSLYLAFLMRVSFEMVAFVRN